jgi:lysozyme
MMPAAAAAAPLRDRMSYARELVEFYEGFRSHAYRCQGDPPKFWTIGFGHCSRDVYPGMVISRHTAEQFLEADLARTAAGVAAAIDAPLSEKSFGALISFSYNVGLGAFTGSTMNFLISQKKYLSAAEQFKRWRTADGEILPGLIKRRAAERALFLEGLDK